MSRIAKRVGTNSTYLKQKLQRDGWDHVRQALIEERDKVGDSAEICIQYVIKQRGDLKTAASTARWYLERKETKRGYRPEKKTIIEGGDKPLHMQQENVVSLESLNLPLSVRQAMLKAIEKSEKKREEPE